MKIVLSKDVNVQRLFAEENSRLDHDESLLQPGATGHHSQVTSLII